MKKKEMAFEDGLTRLEEIIQQLEGGALDLDRSLSLFEDGIKLSRQLNQKLTQAEKKLELLLKDENGQLEVAEFPVDPDEPENV
ncbi:MAG: exodeoxyribonuclease VII small subunit [Deltaproteobacteria bacterium]|nr:exodeoxyribonuclease VII small subunit [Deltaproteobacteria bacterium]